jgi:hypothetical protein
MARNRIENALTRPRPELVTSHWPPAVPVVPALSRNPDDRALHQLAVAYGHIDELRRHLAVFRETMAAPAPAAADHEGRELAHHAVQMERALVRALRAAREVGAPGLLAMVEDAYNERNRVRRAVEAAIGRMPAAEEPPSCRLLLASFAR